MGNRIQTERLWLRQLDLPEAEALIGGARPAGDIWAPGYPTDGTLVAAGGFVRRSAAGVEHGPYGMYQLVRRADRWVIGDIGFHGPPTDSGDVVVGYGLAFSARKAGYATEALRGLVAWALDQPPVRRVQADTTHGNLPSQRVMERVGMRLVGESAELRYYEVP